MLAAFTLFGKFLGNNHEYCHRYRPLGEKQVPIGFDSEPQQFFRLFQPKCPPFTDLADIRRANEGCWQLTQA